MQTSSSSPLRLLENVADHTLQLGTVFANALMSFHLGLRDGWRIMSQYDASTHLSDHLPPAHRLLSEEARLRILGEQGRDWR
jgi:hypothetical protein